ncbi:MAG: hypothetical protein Q8M29_06120 [Bacteroidota bacterium]|nr:hypothetical protein [Bacteroidota bacterium]
MLKKVFLLILLLNVFITNAQESVSIGLVGEYSENFSISNYSGGFQVEVPVGDKFTLNYKGLIGGSDDRTLYAHAPVGAAFGTILLRYLGSSNSNAINAFGVILMAIPEGLTFYPNPDAKIRAGIYIAPLGCDYWYKRNNYEYFRFSGEFGGKIKIHVGGGDKVDILLQGGLKYLYRNKYIEPVFVHASAGISFNLN